MKAVMYGAGSIGRGFIGALFSEIGYEVVFIDVNDDVIHLINKEKTYPQIIMNEEQPVHWIKNIRAGDGTLTIPFYEKTLQLSAMKSLRLLLSQLL